MRNANDMSTSHFTNKETVPRANEEREKKMAKT